MGTGDWNDGMNRVGHKGKGESVWLGVVPARDALRSSLRLADVRGEHERARPVAGACLSSEGSARAGRVGRRLVSACLFRRRDSARICVERRVPHRLDRSVLGRASRGGRPRRAARGRWQRSRSISFIAETVWFFSLLRPSTVAARSRLHQGLFAGRAGEWRPVHPRSDLGGHRLRHAWRG